MRSGASGTRPAPAVDRGRRLLAVIPEKYRFILFAPILRSAVGPAVACLTFIALFFVSSRAQLVGKELVLVWRPRCADRLLMWGGNRGLPYVSQDRWGGLP